MGLELEGGLPLQRIPIGLGGTVADGPLIAGGLPDGLERAQAVELGQAVASFLVALVVRAADAVVFARVAADGIGDVRGRDLRQPAAQPAFRQRQMRGGRGDELELFDELQLAGGEASVPAPPALLIQPGEQAEAGVGIQSQPGDGWGVGGGGGRRGRWRWGSFPKRTGVRFCAYRWQGSPDPS